MSNNSSPIHAPKRLCVPVELNEQKLTNEENLRFKLEFEDYPGYRLTYFLIKVCLINARTMLLMVSIGIFRVWFDYSPIYEEIVAAELFLTVGETTCTMFSTCSLITSTKRYIRFKWMNLIFFALKIATSLRVIVLGLDDRLIVYIYSIAFTATLVIEFFAWKLRKKYFADYEACSTERMLDCLKETFGSDHKLGEPNNYQYELLTTMTHDLMWPEISKDSNNDITFPSYLLALTKNQKTVYFVPWKFYFDVNCNIIQDISEISDLKERNKALRNDLKRQIYLVVQLQWKINFPHVNANGDKKEPAQPPSIVPRRPKKIAGMFVLREEIVEGFVCLDEYRKLVVYSATVRHCLNDHQVERRQLKNYLQKTQESNNILIENILAMTLPIVPENTYVDINDVN